MKSRFDAALRALSAGLPSVLAAAGATSTSTAAHDLEIVRTVGAGFAGPGGAFRALDLVVAAPAMLLPIGTRALRSGLASALALGICGALAFDLARALVQRVPAALDRLFPRSPAPPRIAAPAASRSAVASSRLLSAVAAAAVLAALLAPAWQVEAAAPGGAVTGALLVLLALRLGAAQSDDVGAGATPRSVPRWMLVLGLSASYDPLVLVASLGALLPPIVTALRASRKREERASRDVAVRGACAFALGLLPLALGVALTTRSPEVSVAGPLFAFLPLARAGTLTPASFALAEIGATLLFVCASGAAMALLVADARRRALPLVLVVVVAALAVWIGAASGPSRFAPVVLAGVVAAYVLGATMLAALVLAIARARVPFAEASAALVVVLELVLPVRSIDETLARRAARAAHASVIWSDVAWGSAPPAAVILVSDRGTMRRIASARAVGQMRGDLVIVPAFDVQGREGQRALIAEPKLAPLYRDIALGVRPEELSLSELVGQRPVLATFDPRWDRALSRHLVPDGLFSRFEMEPRGASERKAALEAFLPAKERLVRVAVAKRDPELAAATATLLRARAIGVAAIGERELLSRALDDLRAFAPDDATGATLVRRMVTTKGGPIDVRDLPL